MSQAKENAAMAALDFVEDGMTLGLGSGSTAEIFLERLGERIAGGLKVQGIPTSQRTADIAIENGVPLVEPDKVESIQLTIDGADEVDPQFSLITRHTPVIGTAIFLIPYNRKRFRPQ